MQYILGIDGGGTSTVAIIVSETGKIMARTKSGPSNPNTTNKESLIKTFHNVFLHLRQQVGEEIWHNIVHVFAGISGAEHENMKEIIYESLRITYSNACNVTVDNDAVTALYAGTLGKYGIVQISGTGSITYGINSKGKRDRVGGWGHYISENCSGYYIGQRGLNAAFNAYDGTGKKTLLVEKFIRHFQVGMLPDLVHAIYHAENTKEQIARLALLVFQAAEEGDDVSIGILHQTGRNIGKAVVTLSDKLFTKAEKEKGVNVIVVGSIFKQIHRFNNGITSIIKQVDYPITFLPSDYEPVFGAVFCGMLHEGLPITHAFIKELENERIIHKKF